MREKETLLISIKSLAGAIALSCLTTIAHAQMIELATNPQGTFFYAVGAAVAQVMQQKANLPTRVKAMSGSSAYAPLVNRGDIEFGLATSMDIGNAYMGIEGYQKNPDLRLVAVMFPLPLGIAVPNDSPVKSMKDLKGLRMASQFTSQKSNKFATDALLATGGLTIADIKGFPVSDYGKGMAALGEGKVDAAIFCLGCAAAQEANISLSAHGGLRFLQLSDTAETMAAIRKVLPSASTQVFQPSPAHTGVIVPTRLLVYSVFLVASTHTSDEVVYKTTKAIHESKAVLAASAAVLKTFDPSMMVEANTVPYHPGAEKFYKEVGQWPPKKR